MNSGNLGNYVGHLAIYLSVYAVVALSLNLIVGYCGILTLAHAGYFAIGAYTYALLALNSWDFLPAVGVAALLAATASLTVSLATWRLRGDFFVLVSLAVQALIYNTLANWGDPSAPIGTWTNLTGGTFGIQVTPPEIGSIKFDTIGRMAALSLVTTVACGVLLRLLHRSPWGRVLQAIRDDELAARGLGKNTRLLKVQAFALSCALVAIAGAIYAGYVGYIEPGVSSLDHSILMLAMVVVGGSGNLRGPLVGAALLVAFPEILRAIEIPARVAAEIRVLAYGLLLVVVIHYRPEGLAGKYRID